RSVGPGRPMKWVFWASVAVIAYTHLGYAAWLWLRSRWRFQPVKSGPCEPSVSIVMVVRNEAHVLESKLQNLLTLNYPAPQREIVVFTDARQPLEPEAVRLLAENFADPAVGCVSGELMLRNPGAGEAAKGLGLYWSIEKKIRELESASGSVVGASGALYAVR